MLNGKRLGRLPLSDPACHGLVKVSREQGSGHHLLSGMLHWRPGVVKNEQGLHTVLHGARKLVKPTTVGM